MSFKKRLYEYFYYYLGNKKEKILKSKFCAMRDRGKIIEPLLESYPQVLVTTSLNGFTSYLLAIVWLTLLLYNLLLVIMLV